MIDGLDSMISVSVLVDISLASNVIYCCHVTPL